MCRITRDDVQRRRHRAGHRDFDAAVDDLSQQNEVIAGIEIVIGLAQIERVSDDLDLVSERKAQSAIDLTRQDSRN